MQNQLLSKEWKKTTIYSHLRTYSTSSLKGKINLLWKDFIKLTICKTIELRVRLNIKKFRLKLIASATEKDRFVVFVGSNQWKSSNFLNEEVFLSHLNEKVTFIYRNVVWRFFFIAHDHFVHTLKSKHKSWKFVNSTMSCIAWSLLFFSQKRCSTLIFHGFTIISSTLKVKRKSWKFVNSTSWIAWALPFFSQILVNFFLKGRKINFFFVLRFNRIQLLPTNENQ